MSVSVEVSVPCGAVASVTSRVIVPVAPELHAAAVPPYAENSLEPLNWTVRLPQKSESVFEYVRTASAAAKLNWIAVVTVLVPASSVPVSTPVVNSSW